MPCFITLKNYIYSRLRKKRITVHFINSRPRGRYPSGLRQESRPLAASKTGSPRFTDSLSHMTNLIGSKTQNEYSAHAQKLGAARGLDSWRRPEGSRPLGTRMHFIKLAQKRFINYSTIWTFCAFW